ncbi:MAG: CO dehydrogenase/CO-methylating acetyl-CoA synthase complex subunit beta, partial [Lachnospiraceae bacterium]|nr:CO dehydrogenase/CO-methylating acetyl-CoA synthase complex subunit beta [Lachnospiraceae bacterium]
MGALTDLIYGGSNAVAGLTEGAVNDAIAKHGEDAKVSFGDTAYFLPPIYAATGVKVAKLGDLPACVGVLKSLITNEEDLGAALNAGLATAVGAEILEALKYVENENPYAEDSGIGFVPDPIIRSLGVPLVTGDIPGVAVILGKADNAADVAKIVKDYQSKGIMSFLVGDVIEQCMESGVKIGLDYRVVPLGHDVTAVIHVVTVAIRAALIFGNVKPGDLAGLLAYTKERVPAYVNTFGALDAVTLSAGAGAIALGFPVITDIDLGDLQIAGALESVTDHDATVKKSLELRNIKIKVTEIPIPVAFASTYEGEIIRRGDMQIEFDGSRKDCFELVVTKDASEIEDHEFKLIGPDFDAMEEGSKQNIAYIVNVAGKNMQSDFEPVFERKFHSYINCVEGIMHTGQRDMIRVRISKDTFAAGFRAKDLAEVLYCNVMNEFDAVVDKCSVTIVTDAAECTKLRHELAVPAYDARDERLTSLTDESVPVYYSCIMCQAFSPSHVCVVTPERLGLCGAVSWLDAKATNQLDPEGPCQVITKERVIDENLGRYEDVDEAVNKFSQGALEHVTLYSIMEDPMTSCGCFECICGIEPFSNGVIIANREYAGMTPLGMTFADLAGMTGGGVQTPGFMGHGKHFISSKKFMKAEGGVERIVWMPKDLK